MTEVRVPAGAQEECVRTVLFSTSFTVGTWGCPPDYSLPPIAVNPIIPSDFAEEVIANFQQQKSVFSFFLGIQKIRIFFLKNLNDSWISRNLHKLLDFSSSSNGSKKYSCPCLNCLHLQSHKRSASTGADSCAAQNESAVQPDPRVREHAAAGDRETQPAERGRHSAPASGRYPACRIHLGGDGADGQAAAVWVRGERGASEQSVGSWTSSHHRVALIWPSWLTGC